jgi:surfactin synthase thioesterase subunit
MEKVQVKSVNYHAGATKDDVKVIALPYGGGNKYSFRAFEKALPIGYQWCTVELPGRGDKIRQPLLSDVHEMVEAIYQEVLELTQQSTYLMYGHSMGTLIGYELVKRMAKEKKKLPSLLFFTGRGAPSVEREKKISGLDKVLFWEEIGTIGGMPADILKHRDLLEIFEPILRQDFKALENYRYTPLEQPLTVPLFICTGDKEDIKPESIGAWQYETSFPIVHTVLPGDHFFIFDHPQQIVQAMVSAHKTAIAPSQVIANEELSSAKLLIEL